MQGSLKAEPVFSPPQFEIIIRLTNLLNKVYVDISGVPLPGRWMSAGIKFSVNNL
jgi:hypothetical protein